MTHIVVRYRLGRTLATLPTRASTGSSPPPTPEQNLNGFINNFRFGQVLGIAGSTAVGEISGMSWSFAIGATAKVVVENMSPSKP